MPAFFNTAVNPQQPNYFIIAICKGSAVTVVCTRFSNIFKLRYVYLKYFLRIKKLTKKSNNESFTRVSKTDTGIKKNRRGRG